MFFKLVAKPLRFFTDHLSYKILYKATPKKPSANPPRI